MFSRILIANRGEIAVRIIRACKEMGIATVAVYSEVDKKAMHVQLADEAVCIGKESLKETYLNMHELVIAAKRTNAEAIHPGYGFLSENHLFAELVEMFGFVFIGPSSQTISRMGDKVAAIKTAISAKVPVIPGSHRPLNSDIEALQVCKTIGFPVIIKAAAGGGGKGMRIVHEEAQLPEALHAARNESRTFFGNDCIYIEKYIETGRHVEVQILADRYGNAVALGERDCSIQRRHQKLIEESPAPLLTEKTRKQMFETAVNLARKVDYSGAGTVEFLLDPHNNFYFIEMNTRIQVEHPVTEMCTSIDIVKEQLRIASGERLAFTQKQICMKGHAIECRINAEDPQHNFMPSPGRIKQLFFPGGPGIRIDSHIYPTYIIPHQYDSLIAKFIVHAEDRDAAIVRMKRALREFDIRGVKTTVGLLTTILSHERFVNGNFSTHFLQDEILSRK